MEVLNFVFSSFWTFVGSACLISLTGKLVIEVIRELVWICRGFSAQEKAQLLELRQLKTKLETQIDQWDQMKERVQQKLKSFGIDLNDL